MLKALVSILLTIAASVIFRKTGRDSSAPESHNGIFLASLLPVAVRFLIAYGRTDFSADFLPFFWDVLYAVFSAVWVQVLVIGVITSFFKAQDSDGKISLGDLVIIVLIFTATGAIDGSGLHLLYSFCIGLVSAGLFLRTHSIDLSVTLHILFNAVSLYGSTFVTMPALDDITRRFLTAADCLILVILAAGLLGDSIRLRSSEEVKFHG